MKESATRHGDDGLAAVQPRGAPAGHAPDRLGLRLALVQVWATATIAALVAGPGLGNLITEGFYRTDYGMALGAAVVVAVVAFLDGDGRRGGRALGRSDAAKPQPPVLARSPHVGT